MMEDSISNETAKCFVPEMLVDFLSQNLIKGKDNVEPASFFIQGVCLLVDISGFTKLSGDFCGQGRSGIDELQLATNGFMGKLVNIIYAFGGEIIKFAGDAIICVFSSSFITAVSTNTKNNGRKTRRSVCGLASFSENADDRDRDRNSPSPMMPMITISGVSAEVVLRAMHCAKELREVQTEKLSVHVAMSCGEMCFGILGGFENRWECLISGPCIHQLSDCLDEAPSKQAVISAGCAAILKNIAPDLSHAVIDTESDIFLVDLTALPSGNCRILTVECGGNVDFIAATALKSHAAAPSSESDSSIRVAALIRQFVPVPVAEELDNAAGLSGMAKIREVTTMFMKV